MIRLIPMGGAEFEVYLDRLVRSYAEENIRAGRWSEQEGLVEARKQIQGLLPAGYRTPNHFFFSIVPETSEERLGAVWLAIEPRGGFVYDLVVFEPFRRRGYAEQAMRLLESVTREKGAQQLLLQVYGSNHAARNLYAKLGYTEAAVYMSKTLTR